MESIVSAIIAGGLALGICKNSLLRKHKIDILFSAFSKKDIAH